MKRRFFFRNSKIVIVVRNTITCKTGPTSRITVLSDLDYYS